MINLSHRRKYVINPNGEWPTTSVNPTDKAVNYFTDLYHPSSQPSIKFPGVICKRILSEKARDIRCQPFQLDEVKNAVFEMDDKSSLGPDGLNAKFYKLHWEQMKTDIWNAMNGILQSCKIIKEITPLYASSQKTRCLYNHRL